MSSEEFTKFLKQKDKNENTVLHSLFNVWESCYVRATSFFEKDEERKRKWGVLKNRVRDMMYLLLKYGADPNVRGKLRCLVEFIAHSFCVKRDPDVKAFFRYLLWFGADREVHSFDYWQDMEFIEREYEELVKMEQEKWLAQVLCCADIDNIVLGYLKK